jgi:hypothetical protein
MLLIERPNQRIELTPGHIFRRYAASSVAGAVHARRYTPEP